jgi:hypothetical protein
VTDDLARLREATAGGDRDAEDQLVELAGERGDLDELRRLADSGNSDAVDLLVESAGERAPGLGGGRSPRRGLLEHRLWHRRGGRLGVSRSGDGV